MGKIIGIDLGTTNSVIAVIERGQPKVIPNLEGSLLTPSLVAFDEGGKVLVGEPARRRVLVDPAMTVVSAKRLIGLGPNDPIVRRAPFNVVTAPGGDLAFERFLARHSPAEICAHILTHLKRAADDYFGEPVTAAVISVPLSFNERQRQVIRDAGTIAGLEIKRIINEPSAVALAYGLRKTKEQLIAVCSMGGGSFEVSILEVGDKVVESVAGCGDNHVGGDDFKHRLTDWLVGEFRKDTSIDVSGDKNVIQRLREAAERAKLELSERQETEIYLPALIVDASGPKHLQKTLSRAMFESLIEDLVERTIVSCKRALSDAGKRLTDLHALVLAGGSTRIPRVGAKLEEFFGRKADRSMNADEAVALGAAIQAGCMSGDLMDLLLLDTMPLSLAIEIAGGVANVLIPRNTTIPTRKTELVSIPTADHTVVSLHVIQGERPAAKDNPTIGRFQLTGLPSVPLGVRPIEVTFDIDANAVVHLTAMDQATGLGERFRIGLGGDSRPVAARTVAAPLPRHDVPPAASSRSRSTSTTNGIGTYSVTIEVGCVKEHTCLCCRSRYRYRLQRKLVGKASNAASAQAKARAAAARAVERDVDMQPCPTCGRYQPDMIAQRRARRHKYVLGAGLVAFVLLVSLRVSYVLQDELAIWLAVAGCVAAAAAHLIIDLANPNRNLDRNRQLAAKRVATGAVDHQAGQDLAGKEYLVGRSRPRGHRMTIAMLLGAGVLAAAPEGVRVMRGWPLNSECYPPVIGPGDEVRIYMPKMIQSIHGYWRGQPRVTLQERGMSKPFTAQARTNQNDWGDTIRAKSSEERSSSTPWVSVTVPNDAALSGKQLSCEIELKVTYPEVQGHERFQTSDHTMWRRVDVQLASTAGAGSDYDGWWWRGTVAAMALVLLCGAYLIWAAGWLARKAHPTRVYPVE